MSRLCWKVDVSSPVSDCPKRTDGRQSRKCPREDTLVGFDGRYLQHESPSGVILFDDPGLRDGNYGRNSTEPSADGVRDAETRQRSPVFTSLTRNPCTHRDADASAAEQIEEAE